MNLINILAGSEQQGDDDKEYELSTLEKQEEFAKKRNYHYTTPELDDQDKIRSIDARNNL